MNLIDVTIEPNFSGNSQDVFKALDKHPLPVPVKPILANFRMKGNDKDKFDTDKFNEALAKYEQDLAEWNNVYVKLPRYSISELECVSGIRLNANVIAFHCNEPRKAILNEDGTVIITHKKY